MDMHAFHSISLEWRAEQGGYESKVTIDDHGTRYDAMRFGALDFE